MRTDNADTQRPFNGRPRVLVVDAEEAIVSLLSRMLASEGYRVTCVTNGQAALTKVKDTRYDAIICDLWMPAMDGLAFYEELAHINADQASRVIFCTSLAISDLQPLLPETSRDLLLKPFQIEEVYNMVGAVVNGSRVKMISQE